MKDLFDEVNEELQEEKRYRFIQRCIKFFITLAFITLVGVSIYVWKEKTIENLQNQLGEYYNQALLSIENNKFDEAISYLDKIIEQSHQQYSALAYFNKAALLFKQNKFEQGEKTLLELAKHKRFDLAIRELAEFLYLGNQLNHNKIISKEHSELLTKLTKEKKPWRLSSLQLKALYAIKQNQINDAKTALSEILASKQATKSSYDIASSIMSSLSKTE